ncbi:GNAT family N-acetyltransferase [bacterium M00.F.Ca.ET.228.01.1.1]|uniref:GNAT family N-acetyltransferase n=1 Tax=Paraburkholderia phenoliruptrix TaxID=252970 RepID=UPI001091A1E3|nr:GNAT family N-acetyltransferase [Paraburkholderia phenoliruptrix]MBW9098921.1 GNAT family N-acetyltransferase [Paraburkholderia phenoliruptrix]TGP42691.1 GNAT family N-acetyltransferase [bacterium M00.F.Ca.ET.228.01.1.1]TGR95416.1 GNAT family N-acetyltransferase [bacterium M00.F.Ca.ET.191.01.1.1]TGT96305.1 GNAT family N-acetyltransferase [bacterium M00.F.Ca.ET.155.01.1.1]
MQPEIRSADLRDLSTVQRITERAYAVWISVLGYPPQPVTDDHARRIARGEVLLACIRGEVVGLVIVESDVEDDLIFNVAVDPDYAGNGIGSRLIAEVEHRARANGRSGMRLYTNALMSKNIALYSKLGYVETGRRRHPAHADSTIVDMAKSL